jgi:hypothetical protein
MNCISFKQNILNTKFNLINDYNCDFFKKHSIKLFFKLNCYNKSHPKYFKLLEFYSDLSLGK